MKISYFLLLACLLLPALSNASDVRFIQSVNRLTAPAMLVDVIDTESAALTTLAWPSELTGWVTQQQITHWLNNQRADSVKLTWSGRNKTWVSLCFPIKESELRDSVTSELSAQLAKKHVVLEQLMFEKLPCANSPEYSVRFVSLKRLGQRNAIAKFTVLSDEKSTSDIDVTLRYSAMINVLELNHSVAKFDAVNKSNFSIVKQLWTGKELPAEAVLTRHEFKKSMRKGHAVMLSDIQLKNAVTQGQMVKVMVTNGPVVIEAKGRAMTSANEGEQIKVKVNGSNSLSNAVVVAEGEVHVSV